MLCLFCHRSFILHWHLTDTETGRWQRWLWRPKQLHPASPTSFPVVNCHLQLVQVPQPKFLVPAQLVGHHYKIMENLFHSHTHLKFESRQEHKNIFEFFQSKMLCWLAVGVPNPCVYTRAQEWSRMHVKLKDPVVHVLSEFSGLRKNEKIQHALYWHCDRRINYVLMSYVQCTVNDY